MLENTINLKIKQFNDKGINVEYDDILNFLENIYFKHEEKSEESLEKFLNDDNIDIIVNFLLSDALINPKY